MADVEIANSAGATLVGTMVATLLAGVAVALCTHYFRSFPSDRGVFKTLALTMLATSLTLTVIVMYNTWQVLIVNYGDIFFQLKMSWPMTCLFPFAAVSCTTLEFFLAYRAWVLSGRSRWWAAYQLTALALSLASLAVAIWHAQWYGRQEFTIAVLERKDAVWAWWGLQISGEAAVTASLIYWVIWQPEREQSSSSQLSRIGFASRFALRAAETNLVSILAQLVIVILFANTDRFGFWFATIGFSIPSLYTISLMLALLSRASEEATFAFEATNSPRLTRAKATNTNPIVSKVDVDIRNQVAVDVRMVDDAASVNSQGGMYRTPKIEYSKSWREPTEKEEYEMEAV